MKYLHCLLQFAAEPLALPPAKISEILAFLAFKAEGGELSAEQVEARVSQQRTRDVSRDPTGRVAVLPIFGMIAPRLESMQVSERGTAVTVLQQQFRALLNDDSVTAIVMQYDSPGGVANGIEEFGQEIFEAREAKIKPIVSQVDSLAASAAYWLAVQAEEVIVTPSGSAGSIGVYMVHEDVTAMLEKLGVKRTLVKAGKNKAIGNPFEPLSDDARAYFQERVDDMNRMFVKAVARGRKVTQAKVSEDFGQGLTFHANDLVKRGMADKVASLKDTLERFGVDVSPGMRPATVDMRRALAVGAKVTERQLAKHLREEGFPKAAAERVASALHRTNLRDAEGGTNPANVTEADPLPASDRETAEAYAAFQSALKGFKLPSL